MAENSEINSYWKDYQDIYGNNDLINDELETVGMQLVVVDEQTGELIYCGYLYDHLNHFDSLDDYDEENPNLLN